MRFHWHNLLNAIALGIDPPFHGDRKGFGSYAAKTFVSPTFNSCFLDSGSKHSAWRFGGWIRWVAWHFPLHNRLASVVQGYWKMSEKKGLTGSSDSAANWQLWHAHSPKCPDSWYAWTVKSKTSFTRLNICENVQAMIKCNNLDNELNDLHLFTCDILCQWSSKRNIPHRRK